MGVPYLFSYLPSPTLAIKSKSLIGIFDFAGPVVALKKSFGREMFIFIWPKKNVKNQQGSIPCSDDWIKCLHKHEFNQILQTANVLLRHL